MSALARLVLAFLALKLVNLSINVLTFPVLCTGIRSRPRGTVSLLVPVRDEEQRLPETLPAIARQAVDELLILDDCSSDASAATARSITAGNKHARVIAGTPTPAGWTGKAWACQQLGEAATGELLIFCDADVVLTSQAVTAIGAELRRQGADLLSVFPRQRTRTLAEHLLIPLVDDVLLCFLPVPLLETGVTAAATANGSVLAFTRAAYLALGGFSAVHDAVIEDVAMARHVRRAGFRLGLVLGGQVVQTRMYTGYRAAIVGFGRGLLWVTGGSRPRLAALALWHVLVYTAPVVLVVLTRQRLWAYALAAGAAERLIVEAKTGRRQWWQAGIAPFGPLAALPVIARAMGRRQSWRGRAYRT
jgi:glycosyltransferase involved in cell wall biosynthesis